jgi:hypothetical protein
MAFNCGLRHPVSMDHTSRCGGHLLPDSISRSVRSPAAAQATRMSRRARHAVASLMAACASCHL